MSNSVQNPDEFIPTEVSPDVIYTNPLERIKGQLIDLRTNFFLMIAPGSKEFKDVTKRFRLMLIAITIPSLFVILKLFIFESSMNLLIWLGIALSLAIFSYAGMLWGIKFLVRKESLSSILNIVPVYVFTSTIFFSLVFIGPINRVYLLAAFLLSMAVYMVLLYVLLLTVNILNVNLFYLIPLSKLGETLLYIFSVISFFVLSLSVTSMFISSIADGAYVITGLTVAMGIIIPILLYYISIFYYTPVQGGIFQFSYLLGIITFISIAVFGLFLNSPFMVALYTSLEAYVILGMLIHKTQNTLKPQVYVEYFVIFIILILGIIIT